MKQQLYTEIERMSSLLTGLADDLFDHPELGGQEVYACEKLTSLLAKEGFAVEMGVGGMPTAFRATYTHGAGGSSIGLLCEYDALRRLGHACGHHMQGPAILGAAIAIKELLQNKPLPAGGLRNPG